jgi:putative ABC transport system permease protein
MNVIRFIRNNLTYYWKKNLLLATGIAISTAVLTGALIVGDSVDYSLNRIVDQRLGKVTHVMRSPDRYFTDSLAARAGSRLGIPVSPLLLQQGMAVAAGGEKRINRVQVLGVDGTFDLMAGQQDYFGPLSGDTVIISGNLASRLSVGTGDEIQLRVRRASLAPENAPFVSETGSVVTLRATVASVAGEDRLGRFNLEASQTAPFNVFVSRSRLERLMDLGGKANVLLFDGGGNAGTEAIRAAVDNQFTAADAGLHISTLEEQGQIQVKSDRVFIDSVTARALQADGGQGRGIITYFVNELRAGDRATPYSFVSTLPGELVHPGEIIINRWLAEDLQAGVGDSVRITYYVVGLLRELKEASASFRVSRVVPVIWEYGDSHLMPDIPGLSDVSNCRDWDTGVPIDLDRIRDRDEDYWDTYRGTPKAYISVSRGVELWSNRFGTYTSFRFDASETGPGALAGRIMEHLDPSMLGYTIEPVREQGYEAAGSGVDFSQLFGGLSFFLLVAGVLLAILLFLLNLESRQEQLQTLVYIGIPVKVIRRIMLAESMAVAVIGAGAGLLLAVLYNRLVFLALNGVWKDIIRTDMMLIHIRTVTLLTGLGISLAVSFLALWFPLTRLLKKVQRKQRMKRETGGLLFRQRITASASLIAGAAGAGLIIWQLARMEVVNATVFFIAGGLLLVAAVFFILWNLGRTEKKTYAHLQLPLLSWKNALRNRTRSISIVILFAIGSFLVISTGSFRQDMFRNADDPGSGTGGFLFYAESTVPVLRDLNDPEVRFEYGLEGAYRFVQMRMAAGDDASCLNLNRVSRPPILGVDPEKLDGRFSFVTRTGQLDGEKPWHSLQEDLPEGVVPAIADETVIKWGLGMEVGDTLHYLNSRGKDMDLLLIGGLAPSVFQGRVLISNTHFLEHFPESSGTSVFLVGGARADSARIRSEIERGLRDFGWDMQLAAVRLVEFHSITNTYLSIFLVMGALGLLLGTFGLVVVLSRSIMERRQEIALLKAVGYGRKTIRKLVVREYVILLLMGIGSGFLTAVIATLPSITSPNTGTSFTTILLLLLLLVGNGWLWIRVVTASALKERTLVTALRNE